LDSSDVSSGCGDVELRDVEERFGNLQVEELDPKIYKLRTQPVKKQGETISKGHKNYELMLNLQLGIRYLGFGKCFFVCPDPSYCSCLSIICHQLFGRMLIQSPNVFFSICQNQCISSVGNKFNIISCLASSLVFY
jgi:hypothetical protein